MGDVIALDGGLFPQPERQPRGDTSRGRGFAVEIERRLTVRQRAAIAAGQHPLAAAVKGQSIRLHPDALATIMYGPAGAGPTCGDCAHRGLYNGGHARSYPKCLKGMHAVTRPDGGKTIVYPRVTNGAATDVRREWPACIDHEPIGRQETGSMLNKDMSSGPSGLSRGGPPS